MAYSLIAHAASGGDGNVATTGTFDSTGANHLLVGVALFNGAGHASIGDISDSKGNSWSLRTLYATAGGIEIALYQGLQTMTVGTGHTVTFTRSGSFPSIAASAWSGAALSVVLDAQTGNNGGSASTIQPGSLSPSQDNDLLFTAVAAGGTTITSIDSGFSILDNVNAANSEPLAVAYKIQTTAGAENPTWTLAGTGDVTANQSAWFAAAASGNFLLVKN